MQQTTHTPTLPELRRAIQTAALAQRIGYKPASIRTAVWRNGHFQGIKLFKLPSGRLLWPADAVERLTAVEVAQ
ncbi:DNA-binding protein [Aromatoleum anaerobium]|uniref:DNA-binding protein n=1 Tax=Aromatoleum anaerobium TaxID=182180 RepID=A0ABX1PNF7_9RHOO|nr:DNA-binding protein [Aromatoleum anaerobium]MCK0506321.1 DNA-binding protein [Aromatoleum anaerobium]